jgi:hypothetical protein
MVNVKIWGTYCGPIVSVVSIILTKYDIVFELFLVVDIPSVPDMLSTGYIHS